MSETLKVEDAVRGPSTRRIKLEEEAAAEEAIKRQSIHEEGSRSWARRENRPFGIPRREDI